MTLQVSSTVRHLRGVVGAVHVRDRAGGRARRRAGRRAAGGAGAALPRDAAGPAVRHHRRRVGHPGAGVTARLDVLTVGYVGDRVAGTVTLVRDGDLVVVIDPGMVASRDLILDPLTELRGGAGRRHRRGVQPPPPGPHDQRGAVPERPDPRLHGHVRRGPVDRPRVRGRRGAAVAVGPADAHARALPAGHHDPGGHRTRPGRLHAPVVVRRRAAGGPLRRRRGRPCARRGSGCWT